MGWPVMGITQRRVLVRVPSADLEPLCEVNPTDCCGSGSGSGGYCGEEQCAVACDYCPDGMSAQWVIEELGLTLCHVQYPDDGNQCQFITPDGRYRMWFDTSPEFLGGLWLIQDLEEQENIWYAEPFSCNPEIGNPFISVLEGGPELLVTPVFDCTTITYDCTAGGCVGVAGEGGEYATLAECNAVCQTVETLCCEEGVPLTLNWEITNITGDCSCITVTSGTVTYNPLAGQWEGIPFTCLILECEENSTYSIACIEGEWRYGAGVVNIGQTAPTSVTCFPFEAVFDKLVTSGTGTYTITFTA